MIAAETIELPLQNYQTLKQSWYCHFPDQQVAVRLKKIKNSSFFRIQDNHQDNHAVGKENDMKIPKYWARARYEGKDRIGKEHKFVASGWSFTSIQEAQSQASARAKRMFELITTGRKPERYEYHDRPIREERLREIHDRDTHIAVITRNRYGALVLNCTNVLFADVDFPHPAPLGFLDRLLLKVSRRRRKAAWTALVGAKIKEVEGWAARNPDHSFRLYRTREGLRLLFTDRLYNPTGDETARILSELNADPMYVTLTRKQECFRARLTSKPWRCGISNPPNSFPWDGPEAEAKYRKWEDAYSQHDAGFKVCELIREFGFPADMGSIKTIVDIHDQETKIHATAELA